MSAREPWAGTDAHAWTTIGVALLAALLAAFFYTGLYCSDDTRYVVGAFKIAAGEPISVSSVAERRLFFLLPAAGTYAATGSLDAAIAVYGLFFAALAAVTFRAALRLLPPSLATLSALAVVAQPILFKYAGALLPDIASSLFFALALMWMLDWQRSEVRTPAGRGGIRAAVLVGLSTGLAVTIKESGLVLIVIPSAWALGAAVRGGLRPRALAAGLGLLAGFVAVLLVEAIAFRTYAGAWHSSLVSVANPHAFKQFLEEQGYTPIERFRYLFGLFDRSTLVLFAIGVAASVWILGRTKGRGLCTDAQGGWLLVACFLIWPLLYFTVGTASLREYIPPVMQERYYAPCVAPAALLGGWIFAQLLAVRSALWQRARQAILILTGVGLLMVPRWSHGARGAIYAAKSKESYLLALTDAASRYPRVPLVDTGTGWSEDLWRCRLLLRAEAAESRSERDRILHEGGELGALVYTPIEKLNPPFLLVGHGPFWDSALSESYVGKIKARVAQEGWRHQEVGRYYPRPRREVQRFWWLPRTLAVRAALRSDPRPSLAQPVEKDRDRAYGTELHLISPPPSGTAPASARAP